MAQALSVPAVIINGDLVKIVPGSFRFNFGVGNTNVRSASAGGGNVTSVHSKDLETAVGRCAFDLHTTPDNISRKQLWHTLTAGISIEAVEKYTDGSSQTLTFVGMSIVEDTENSAASDGVMSCEFKGDPMIAT